MTAARNFLPLSAVVALLVTLATAFRAAPSIGIQKPAAPIRHNFVAQNHQNRLPTIKLHQEIPNNNSQEQEMMDQALREIQQQQQQEGFDGGAPKKRIDPLIASLTRIDEPTANLPTRQVPLFGEVPADGNLALLVPAAAIGILGFIFSIVVAFNSRDSLVRELSQASLPKMEYTPTKVEEGKCRGLCSSQDEDLDGLRNFMETISGTK